MNPPLDGPINEQQVRFSQAGHGTGWAPVPLQIRTANERIRGLLCQTLCGIGILHLVNAGEDFSLRGKIAATAAAVALTIGLGAVDYFTGREWAISAFYLLPTCLA